MQALLGRMRTSLVMPRVTIELAAVSSEARRVHADRLHAHSRACGCSTGSFVGALALLAWVAYLFATIGMPGEWHLGDVLRGAALSLGLAIAGKLLALIRARQRYVGELRTLLRTID